MAGEVEGWAAISPEGRLAEALEARSAVLAGGARTREAALAPRNPGGLSPGFRAVLAARIAAHHGEVEIAEHYRAATAEADARPGGDGGGRRATGRRRRRPTRDRPTPASSATATPGSRPCSATWTW